jgi:hypothetical protein
MLMKYFSNLILIKTKTKKYRHVRQRGRNEENKTNCVKKIRGIRDGPLK